MKRFPATWLTMSCMLLTACVVPHDVLFVTKSNVGLDVETTPPTAEISVARRELVIAPTFEGGQQPPVLATFRAENKAAATFLVGGSSTFVGGDAAILLARETDAVVPDKICLSAAPNKVQAGNRRGSTIHWPDSTTVVPFIFGTDTSLGLKIGYSGTSVVIDTVKIGFNRKEFAAAPVMLKPTSTGGAGNCPAGDVEAGITSFYAGVERGAGAGVANNKAESNVRLLQAFATGQAANVFVQRAQVKDILLERLEPKLVCSFQESASGKKLSDLVGADQTKVDALNDYLVANKLEMSVPMFLNCDLYEQERTAALGDQDLMTKLNAN